MIIYPGSFPEPTIQGYGIDVDMGVLRTSFEAGNPRQRRKYRTMPHYFNFTFAIKINDLDSWQTWVNQFAYDWFEMDATSYLSGAAGKNCSPHVVRFLSNLAIQPLTHEYVTVSVQAEMHDAGSYGLPGNFTNSWAIAGIPPAPSAPDWYLSNKPQNLPTDWVTPGTPAFPSAIV